MLECDCGLQYVGRTSRALHVRIGEHISNIKQDKGNRSVSKHFRECHQKDPSGLYIRQLSRRESFWIYETKVSSPSGLNVEFDLNCFFSNR